MTQDKRGGQRTPLTVDLSDTQLDAALRVCRGDDGEGRRTRSIKLAVVGIDAKRGAITNDGREER